MKASRRWGGTRGQAFRAPAAIASDDRLAMSSTMGFASPIARGPVGLDPVDTYLRGSEEPCRTPTSSQFYLLWASCSSSSMMAIAPIPLRPRAVSRSLPVRSIHLRMRLDLVPLKLRVTESVMTGAGTAYSVAPGLAHEVERVLT